MPFYKDTQGKLHFLDDISRTSLLPTGSVEITDAEAATIINPPKALPDVRVEKLASLQRSRDAAEQADVTVQGKQFSASKDIADRFEKLSARLRRGKPTQLSAIFTVDGTPVSPVTPQLLEQIEDAIAAQGEAAWNRYAEKVGAVMAATTVEQIDSVVW